MKIAFVYDVIYPYVKGGAEKRIYELSLRLAESGHEVHIFGMKYWDGSAVVEKDGIIYHGLCRPMDLYVKGRRSILQAIYYSVFLFFPLLKERPDVIDCQAFPYFPLLPSWLVSKVSKCSLVVTWHEVWGNYWYDYLGFFGIFGKFIERIVVGVGDLRIAVSGHTKKRLLSLSGRKKIKVVPNAIDIAGIFSICPSGESYDIFAVGRLIPEKNFELLIRATAIIKEKVPGISVGIAGDGPCRDSLAELSGKCGTEENIKFLGFVESYSDLISAMKSAKIFASPSLREGFGISALEAMACGLPVVTVEGGMNAVCVLVVDSGCGIVSQNEAGSFSKAIIDVFNDIEEFGTKGQEYSESYDTDRIPGLYEDVLNSVVKIH
ncbi:glycosyltransferase family 4 protein [Methanolacinia petrolearia]|uniref:glycosyltransferase family 4 protein n=1 Tax=Methanolacinia petrolearia TaxID=54120 RepID=UPI003BAAD6C4